jgi:hypothetical protein
MVSVDETLTVRALVTVDDSGEEGDGETPVLHNVIQ